MEGRVKHELWLRRRPKLLYVGLMVCTALGIALIQIAFPWVSLAQAQAQAPLPSGQEALPEPQVHPLPPLLNQWQGYEDQGDYFSAVNPSPLGYLIWSSFPVTVFIEPVTNQPSLANPTEAARSQEWVDAVIRAVQEWGQYLPLEVTEADAAADIAIWRTAPSIQTPMSSSNGSSDLGESLVDRLPRIRSAETRYQLFVDRSVAALPRLSHRFTIQLSPSQTIEYTEASARHEIGHALGIWGHSSEQTDALYFSQVRHPPPISVRDINTLKRIYEQPTRLGWELCQDAHHHADVANN